MSNSDLQRDPVEELAEEFVERYRLGERPTVEDYAQRFPQYAGEIQELFPALILLEDLAPSEQDLTSRGQNAEHAEQPVALPQRIGEYRLIREVGRGGMGVVYEAEQESLGRHVALKILPAHAHYDQKQILRFQREAKAAARLHHTNIVPVFGVGESRGVYYYAMQFIHGQSLDLVLKEVKRLRSVELTALDATAPGSTASVAQGLTTGHFSLQLLAESAPAESSAPAETAPAAAPSSNSYRLAQLQPYFRSSADVALQVAEALAYAHQHGVIHRDIKPSNLLMDTEGTVWVADFGLAKPEGSEDLTRTGAVLGTLRYMAAESLHGQADARSDVYSLGVTLIELLTLQPAFDDTSHLELMRRIVEGEPVRPRKIDARIPRDLETIALKAASRNITARYQSAQELADDLRRFLAGRPIRARSVGPLERMYRWGRRSPFRAASLILGLVACFALTGLCVSWVFAAQLREQQRLTQIALTDAQHFSRQAESLVTRTLFQGLTLCERQEAGAGLLWMIRALEIAQPGPPRVNELARANLAEWGQTVHALEQVIGGRREIIAVALSPDGKRGATGSQDRTARVWDLATGRELFTCKHDRSVRTVEFSPDGRFLATGSEDGTAGIWDVETGKLRHRLKHVNEVRSASFSADSRRILTGSWDGTACLWDAASGEQLAVFKHDDLVRAAALSADGRLVGTASRDRTARIWDAASGKLLFKVDHPDDVRALAFDPQGKFVVTGCADGVLRVWDAGNGNLRGEHAQHSPVYVLAVSPSGERIASGAENGGVAVCDASSARLLCNVGHRDLVHALRFLSDDGLISGSADNTCRVWGLPDGKPLGAPLAHFAGVRAVAVGSFQRGGSLQAVIFTGSEDCCARLWRLAPPEEASGLAQNPAQPAEAATARVQTAPTRERYWDGGTLSSFRRSNAGYQTYMVFSADGRLGALREREGSVRLWDAVHGVFHDAGLPHEAAVISIAFSPDGGTLATSTDKTVRLWNVPSGELRHSLPLEHKSEALALSPNGQLLATGSHDGLLALWNAASGKLVCSRSIDKAYPTTHAFSPDGRLLCGVTVENSEEFDAGTVRLWTTADLRDWGQPMPHPDANYLAVSPDGQHLVSASFDGLVRFWELATQQLLGEVRHQGYVHAVAFSPQGDLIASTGGGAGAAIVWSANQRRTVAVVPHQSHLNALAFSPSGDALLIGSNDGARLWDARSGTPIGPPLSRPGAVSAVGFNSQEAIVTAGAGFPTMVTHRPAPLTGDIRRIVLWGQTRTGMELTPEGITRVLNAEQWRERRQRLQWLEQTAP